MVQWHDEDMDTRSAEDSAARIGLITLPIGLALVTAPSRFGKLLGTGDYGTALRVIGGLDLALVPGLLAGARRRRWLMARAGLNVVIAGYCAHLVRREGGGIGAKVTAVAMVAATLSDGKAIAAFAGPVDRPGSGGGSDPTGG